MTFVHQVLHVLSKGAESTMFGACTLGDITRWSSRFSFSTGTFSFVLSHIYFVLSTLCCFDENNDFCLLFFQDRQALFVNINLKILKSTTSAQDGRALFVNINFKLLKSTSAQDGRTHLPVCSAWSPHSCSWSQDHHTGLHHTNW